MEERRQVRDGHQGIRVPETLIEQRMKESCMPVPRLVSVFYG